MNPILTQVLSLTGATLVLLAFGGQQFAGLKPESRAYGLLNLVGSLLLAVTAFVPLNAGVLVLESVWALMSLNIVAKAGRARPNS